MPFEEILRDRLGHSRAPDTLAVSIKVRATLGCFHCRGCAPYATEQLDEIARRAEREGRGEFRFEQHETGPEWILYLTATTAGILLAKAVIELITAAIKARAEGQQKHRDKAEHGMELIVRGFDENGTLFEEKVLKLPPGESATRDAVEKALTRGIQKHLPAPEQPPTKSPKKTARKKSKRDKK